MVSAHGTHLGVMDFLFMGDHDVELPTPDNEDEEEDDEEVDETTEQFVLNTVADELVPEFNRNVGPTIHKVRACAKKFRKSPKCNDILQATILAKQTAKGETPAEVTLILDCKTRWNSLPGMFDSLAKCQDALVDLRDMMPDVIPTDEEFEIMNSLRAALKPVQHLTIKLCKENTDVRMADIHFTTAFMMLEEQNTAIADRLKECILNR